MKIMFQSIGWKSKITKKSRFKVMAKGNFYFPFIDKGKEFIVEDTLEIKLDQKYNLVIDKCLEDKHNLFFGILAGHIWNSLKEFNWRHKNYWFIPIQLYKLGEDYICSVDVLKKVNPKKKSNRHKDNTLSINPS